MFLAWNNQATRLYSAALILSCHAKADSNHDRLNGLVCGDTKDIPYGKVATPNAAMNKLFRTGFSFSVMIGFRCMGALQLEDKNLLLSHSQFYTATAIGPFNRAAIATDRLSCTRLRHVSKPDCPKLTTVLLRTAHLSNSVQ